MKRLNCVLLIDDDSVNNFLNHKLFTKLDIANKVEIISEGEKALEFLESFYQLHQCLPELIFIDKNMPGMDGFEFIAKFKEFYPKHPDVKIIFLTAALNSRDKELINEYGEIGYYEKPLTTEKIELILKL